MVENQQYWYAVYTRPRWEKKVASLLQERGIENYCPLNKVLRQWSDRKKTVLEPLFKGYVFVQVAEKDRLEILKVNGVVNFVHWLGKPARIPDHEIEIIRKFLNEFNDVEVTELNIKPASAVQIRQGVMMHYKGIVLELKGSRAVVQINSMGLQLSVVVDRKNLELVQR